MPSEQVTAAVQGGASAAKRRTTTGGDLAFSRELPSMSLVSLASAYSFCSSVRSCWSAIAADGLAAAEGMSLPSSRYRLRRVPRRDLPWHGGAPAGDPFGGVGPVAEPRPRSRRARKEAPKLSAAA